MLDENSEDRKNGVATVTLGATNGGAAGWRQHIPGLVAALVLLALCAGYVVADAFDKVPGVLTTAPRLVQPEAYPSEGVAARLTPVTAQPLETYGAAATLPTAAGIERALAASVAQPILGGKVAVSVFDMVSGKQLYSKDGAVPVAPASATKVVTAAAALSVLDQAARLQTVTKRAGNTVFLVGGGDVTLDLVSATAESPLASASLGNLAAQTATALLKAGQKNVVLRLDTSLFSGPMTLPSWDPSFVTTGIVAPITPLAVNIGRTQPGVEYSPREADPALAAAGRFATALRSHGISVADAPVRATAPATATHLAKVESAPLAQMIDYMLKTSDNTIAEVMGHLVAIKLGQPADFAHAGPAVVQAVNAVAPALKLPVAGLSLADSSGLSNLNRISPDLLTHLVMASYHRAAPHLDLIALALPEAGFSGTLAERFHATNTAPLDGVLRAKTGTLRHILSLTGYVPDADGRLLAFSIVVTNLPDNVFKEGQAAVDQIGLALASCGCLE